MKRKLIGLVVIVVSLFGLAVVPSGASHSSSIDPNTIYGPPNAPCNTYQWGEHLSWAVQAKITSLNNSCSTIGVRLYYYYNGNYSWGNAAWGSGNSCGYANCTERSTFYVSEGAVYIGRRIWKEGWGVGYCYADLFFSDPQLVSGANTVQACLGV